MSQTDVLSAQHGASVVPTGGKQETSASLLDAIYRNREVIDRDGNRHQLNSEITRDEGDLLTALIRAHHFTRTLEIGCAFGISSLFICEALADRPSPQHTIIDPFQNNGWMGIGMHHLEQAGHAHFVELIEKLSEIALPQMVEQKRTFEFALIDGCHTLDHVLLDFFYVNQLLVEGGIVVLDDLQLPAVKKIARYIANFPNYKVAGSAKRSIYGPSWRRRMVEAPLHLAARMLPSAIREQIFDISFLMSDISKGLLSEMVAFQKIGPDQRGPLWYIPF